ncbi:MAG: SDR family oxidoreductase [Verrucomicrobia bacterium]|nr:SDR family oxidoreductase [Verrucomicrobiota bacterium]
MKVLLTGANGYIGTRLISFLAEQGHEIYALVRSHLRIELPKKFRSRVHLIEADLLKKESLSRIPTDIDAAYYLVHSMTYSKNFAQLEERCARNFIEKMNQTHAKQIIYLSGLSNESNLSVHLSSRKNVGEILKRGKIPVTILMAGIIIGSGSASFEIIRDLVEKLPVMVAPRWLNNLIQPIAIRDVLFYLTAVLNHSECLNQEFEIGGPDVLTYKELLLRFATLRGLKRWIITVPVLTPRLSSLWLFFVTSTSFELARSLVDSLINNAICKDTRIQTILPRKLLSFEEAVRNAFARIEEESIPSSWRDSLSGSSLNPDLSIFIRVPSHGTFKDRQVVPFSIDPSQVRQRIWSLGGENGWLAMNWAWAFRGFLDQMIGGIGLRRGRTNPTHLKAGDALDFWRVLLADESSGRLLLYAEMKLPGEGWLEFEIKPNPKGGGTLYQTATFRPNGVFGRFYWYLFYPFHIMIFKGLAKKLTEGKT